jgi:hypothetical protein
MKSKSEPPFRRGAGKSINSYTDASKSLLKKLWKAMGFLGSVRLIGTIKISISQWDNPNLDDYSKMELVTMSASTIESVQY